jgi:putative CocE/NonD family hydrolase
MADSYSVKFESALPIKMRDGITTYADVFRPDAPGKFPVLLQRTPYDRTGPMSRYAMIDAVRAAINGYAFVIEDVRGRYASEGEFHTFVNEIDDGYDSVEWAGSQSWSDGKVGMVGASYVGATQWLAASSAPPSLAGIAPGVTASDYHEGWTYQGGAFELGFNLGWTLAALAAANYENLSRRHNLSSEGLTKLLGSVDNMMGALSYLPLKEWPDLKGGLADYYYAWLDHPEYDDYWKKVSIEEHHPQIKVPALNYGGWYDIFLGGTLQNFMRMGKMGATETARKGQRLLIGPWVHGGVGVVFPGSLVGREFFSVDSYSVSIDLQGRVLRFYDHFLKGMDNGVGQEKPVMIYVMGDNVWREEDEWPLARAQNTPYYLHSQGKANTLNGDGVLSPDKPGGDPPDVFLYNPIDPVPTNGGGLCCFDAFVAPGAYNQSALETRADVLVYSTPPLDRDVEVTGPVSVKLFAASDARDTDFTAKLVDVSADGSNARNLTDGIIRARYRKSKGPAQLLEPGQVYEYDIDLWATSNVFKKGHRIRVEISSSNFPRFDRNTNTGNIIADDATFKTATQTILHDTQHPSHIMLPIVPR